MLCASLSTVDAAVRDAGLLGVATAVVIPILLQGRALPVQDNAHEVNTMASPSQMTRNLDRSYLDRRKQQQSRVAEGTSSCAAPEYQSLCAKFRYAGC